MIVQQHISRVEEIELSENDIFKDAEENYFLVIPCPISSSVDVFVLSLKTGYVEDIEDFKSMHQDEVFEFVGTLYDNLRLSVVGNV